MAASRILQIAPPSRNSNSDPVEISSIGALLLPSRVVVGTAPHLAKLSDVTGAKIRGRFVEGNFVAQVEQEAKGKGGF